MWDAHLMWKESPSPISPFMVYILLFKYAIATSFDDASSIVMVDTLQIPQFHIFLPTMSPLWLGITVKLMIHFL
jgi:hypothetical protein